MRGVLGAGTPRTRQAEFPIAKAVFQALAGTTIPRVPASHQGPGQDFPPRSLLLQISREAALLSP